MKQCMKLDVRIDLEDGTVKVAINSAYLPIHKGYLDAVAASARQLAHEQYAELFDSKNKVKSVIDMDVIPMLMICGECRTGSDPFLGPNDSASHKEGCSKIGNDPRHDIWLENSYRMGTLHRPMGG